MPQKKIVWFAIVLASFIYGVVLWVLAKNWPQPGPFEEAVRSGFTPMFYGIAVMTFVLAHLFPRFAKAKQPAYIASLALFESVAIYGLLAAFLRQDWRLYIAPWALALIGFFTKFPSEGTEEEKLPA